MSERDDPTAEPGPEARPHRRLEELLPDPRPRPGEGKVPPRARVRAHLARLLKVGAATGAAVQLSYACIDPPTDDDDYYNYGWCPEPNALAEFVDAAAVSAVYRTDGILIQATFAGGNTDWYLDWIELLAGGTIVGNGGPAAILVRPEDEATEVVVRLWLGCDADDLRLSLDYRLALDGQIGDTAVLQWIDPDDPGGDDDDSGR